ncbi:MAG: MBL fold metallo-hydrolase [Spirochaetia bacterium]|nr:MBL fold metallo-hydrolase [Spirochaetia bacterium]
MQSYSKFYRRFTTFATTLVLVLCGAACSTLDPSRELSPFFHEGRFWNLEQDDPLLKHSLTDMLRWRIFGKTEPQVMPDAADTAPVGPAITARDLEAPEGFIRVTWIGHATAWISIKQSGRVFSIITDPIFGKLPLIGRAGPLPIALTDLPKADVALVSHAHYDHCDTTTLQELTIKNEQIVIYLPEGLSPWAAEKKLKDHRHLRWWKSDVIAGDNAPKGGVTVTMLPSQHWSNRSLSDRMQYHWGSYLIKAGGRSIYFGGDTGFSVHFQKTADFLKQPVDAAILPIGSYSPRWFMRAAHIDPPEALQAASILRASVVLPVHWGTFKLSDEALMEPILYLKREAERTGQRAVYWNLGGHYDISISGSL